MSRMLSKMNLISVVQQLPKEDIETIQGYVEMIEEENQSLKKQLEEYKEEKQEWINLLDMFKNQQKEFIEYLENEIEHNTPRARWKHYNEDGLNDYDVENGDYLEAQPVNITLKEVISKYQEITGQQDGQVSGQV